MILHSRDGLFAVRKGPWKWVEGIPNPNLRHKPTKIEQEQFKPMLFNLEQDPAESNNLIAEHSEVVKELAHFLNASRGAAKEQ